ncbi:unnamed protein product, partial [Didymodactylos carnosus]
MTRLHLLAGLLITFNAPDGFLSKFGILYLIWAPRVSWGKEDETRECVRIGAEYLVNCLMNKLLFFIISVLYICIVPFTFCLPYDVETKFQYALKSIGRDWLDYDQCDRRCKWVYGNSLTITGTRLHIHECECYNKLQLIGIIKRDNDYDPPVMPKTACCGADGINYPTQEAACTNGTYALHGGYCGACSSHEDINIFNITRNNMTSISTKCAVKYVLFGKNSATK